MEPSRLLQQGRSKGKSRAGKGRWYQLGLVCDRKVTGVKVTGWCGSHLCTRVTGQGGGMSMGMTLGSCWGVLGRALDTPSVCFLGAAWVWTQV